MYSVTLLMVVLYGKVFLRFSRNIAHFNTFFSIIRRVFFMS
ncbi:hypothetical protein HMPREF9078_01175 [Capnocytophaga sp. oral taxon 380 str. F0488]|nr:hypothetical protein HMPREF9078_01175 [Capnocytophaga sp. oral taxon 380 str. F0488]